MVYGELVEHDFAEAGESGGQVVEIVSDAPRESSNRLHFCGVLEVVLQSLLLAQRSLALMSFTKATALPPCFVLMWLRLISTGNSVPPFRRPASVSPSPIGRVCGLL